ncbi:MAG: T9SS type A sorting domain-containing protein [Bacteroidales bacterium]|nr:T9SS type A sorting domain-containing protein [Bacteroidales bacterium]
MKTKFKILAMVLITLSTFAYGQSTMELTFTGDNNGQPVTLDSVIVKNLTQAGQVTLYPPDLSLTLLITGIADEHKVKDAAFSLNQNYPNPFKSQTSVQLQLPEPGIVKIVVSNMMGQNLLSTNNVLGAGIHTFSFIPGNETYYFLTANSNGQMETIKMVCNPTAKKQSVSLNYSSSVDMKPILKTLQMLGELPFEFGDELLMIGYSASVESGMIKSPEVSQECIMQFATNIPCIGTPTVDYEGQIYNTIQIYGQCWFKENLNVGIMIPSTQSQTNNSIIERYCMGDMASSCDLFGGLYFWNEMMKYAYETGGQGICPDGWHVPEDIEWQILEGSTDTQYGIGNAIWGNNGWRGVDAGGNLKQKGTELWEYPNTGATNAYGFTALPTGYFVQGGFWGPGFKTYLWSSHPTQKFYRNMDWNEAMILRNTGGGNPAFSVRCIKN